MRTTLELADDLLRSAKIAAVERGITLRELVSQALQRELNQASSRKPKVRRVAFPIFSSKAPGTMNLAEADLTRAEEEEDRRRHGLPA